MMKLSVNEEVDMGGKAKRTNNVTLIIRNNDSAIVHYAGNKHLRAFSDEGIAGGD